MIRRPHLLGLAAISLVFAPALADVPPAMDRVPADAAVIVSVKDLGKLKAGIDSLAKALGVPAAEMAGLMKMDDVLKMPGADATGSAALGVIGMDSEEPEAVAVLPVKDYAAFIKNFGGTGAGLEEIKIEDKPVYVKNLDGGFAAVGANKALVEKFAGKPGSGKSHEAQIGATGKAIAESSDVVVIANIAKFGPYIKEGAQSVKDQVGMAMAMAGGGGDLSGLDTFIDAFVRDASVGIVGLKLSDSGVTLDIGAQFKEGSVYAGYFDAKGKAASLLATLPNQPFLFAMAMDTSSPGVRKLFQDFKEFGQKMQGDKADAGGGMFPTDFMDKADGIAFQIGNSPAPVGGLFLNTVGFIKASKPADLAKSMKDGISAMNGKTVAGVTYTTTYEEGVKAGALTADAWTLKMQADPEDPQSGMINQVNFMLFGPGGLGGYTAQTDAGLVLTYSKNSDLLGQAVASAKSGGANMSADAEVKKISDGLPADRSFEGYVGIKNLMDTFLGILAPMGIAPEIQIPDDVPPVGMAATTHGGGFRMTFAVPVKVITTIKSLEAAMNPPGGDDQDKGAGQLKF